MLKLPEPRSAAMSNYEILGMPISRLEPESFVREFVGKAKAGHSGYVCVPNVHQCITAFDEPDFAQIVSNADTVMSDSVVLHKFLAFKYAMPMIEVLRGDLLTLAICRRAAEQGVPVALVGGKDDATLKKMCEAIEAECPGIDIAFAYSPPFRQLDTEEEQAMLLGARESGAKILFVGLGCPKQERWMARYSSHLPMMLIGVGAAFDFISGQVKTSPDWVHSAGLEWLHRLISEPRRLWRRYLATSPRFVWLFFTNDWRMGRADR